MQQLPADKTSQYRRLFWHVYLSSQSLVLPLGKAPLIHEYDVDIELPVIPAEPASRAWNILFELLQRFFTIQANVYKQLYSPSVSKLHPTTRREEVRKLIMSLEAWYTIWRTLDYSEAHHGEFFHVLFLPMNVAYYSLLALIHRAATTSSSIEDVSEDCFEAARKGLETHQLLYPEISKMGSSAVQLYAVWYVDILSNPGSKMYLISSKGIYTIIFHAIYYCFCTLHLLCKPKRSPITSERFSHS